MSSRAVKFAKLWKEHVFDKSLELAKTYKEPQATNASASATDQVKYEKTEDETLQTTFIASNGDDAKSIDDGEGKKALVLSNVVNQGETDQTQNTKRKKKEVPKTCCGRVRENLGNCVQGSCICTLIMSFLVCTLCIVPLFFVGRGLCCNCPTCDMEEDDDDDDEKCEDGEKNKDSEENKTAEVICESPYKKSDLEEVDLKTNV